MIVGVKYKKRDGDFKGSIFYFQSDLDLKLDDVVLVPIAHTKNSTEAKVFVVVPDTKSKTFISSSGLSTSDLAKVISVVKEEYNSK